MVFRIPTRNDNPFRFISKKTDVEKLYKTEILCADNGNQYFVFIDRIYQTFEIIDAKTARTVFRSEKCTHEDSFGRAIKREMKRLGVNFEEELSNLNQVKKALRNKRISK